MDILFEDNHLIVVDKKYGDLVQGDSTGDVTLADQVKNYIKIKYNKPGDVYLGVPHRLDRPVSGVIVFCRTSKALTRMNEAFRDRKVKKTYAALVEGMVQDDQMELVDYLIKDESRNLSRVVTQARDGAKRSQLSFERIGVLTNKSLLKVDLLSGRPHQIRVQLSHYGHPIIGDRKYQAKTMMSDKTMGLHCRRLEFIHPVTKVPTTIQSRFPSGTQWTDFEGLWDLI